MIKVENIETYGFEAATRGMRNPLQSWSKSDSVICPGKCFSDCKSTTGVCPRHDEKDFDRDVFCIGENDLDLMRRLYKAGISDRKFLRMIGVSMDIIAPVFFLSELDTYKIYTVRNSTSLMHTGGRRDFTLDDFSFEDMDKDDAAELLQIVNKYRQRYAEDKSEHNLRALRQSVSMAYNYRITWTANYEVCANIIRQRRTHRLSEWREFCDILLKELPYLREIMDETD